MNKHFLHQQHAEINIQFIHECIFCCCCCCCCFQELSKELHRKIDIVDEACYDLEIKVAKNEKEVCFCDDVSLFERQMKD